MKTFWVSLGPLCLLLVSLSGAGCSGSSSKFLPDAEEDGDEDTAAILDGDTDRVEMEETVEIDPNGFPARFCDKAFRCRDTVIAQLDESRFHGIFEFDETDCALKYEGVYPDATDCLAACLEVPCSDFLGCLYECSIFQPESDGDMEEQESLPACEHTDECPDWSICFGEESSQSCQRLCDERVYSREFFNQDCPDENLFVTQRFGSCEPVPCQNEMDCVDLWRCDDAFRWISPYFECTEGFCTRETCETDHDCPSWHSCIETWDILVCEGVCHEKMFTDHQFNEDCPALGQFMTRRFGECLPVPCAQDEDCLGLEACNDPNRNELNTFECLSGYCMPILPD